MAFIPVQQRTTQIKSKRKFVPVRERQDFSGSQSGDFIFRPSTTTKTTTPELVQKGFGFGPLQAISLPFQAANFGLQAIQAAPLLRREKRFNQKKSFRNYK